MFTGLIQSHGTVVAMTRRPRPRLVLTAPRLRVRRGDSVAVDGVCLTVAARPSSRCRLVFDLLEETLRATTLGRRRPGDRVNLEPALRVGDPLGGHLVLGHVDGVGRLLRRRQTAGGVLLTIAVPSAIRPYLAPKGSLAVDGVSLTMAPAFTKTTCAVFLIPQTAATTTLGARRLGDVVNLEVDPIARYVVAAIDGAR